MGMKKKQTKKVYELILPFLLPVLFILIWFIWTLILNPKTILPSPFEIIDKALSMTANRQLGEYTLITLKRALAGFLIGGGSGFLLGLANGILRPADISLNPTIRIFRNIPVLVFLTFVILLFGTGERVKIILVAADVFFPIYINTYGGIKSMDKGLIDMGKAYGLNNLALLKELVFPGAFFSLFTSIRQSLRTMWTVLIAIEIIIPDKGIGSMALSAVKSAQMDQLAISIILYAVLSKLSDGIAGAFERRVLSWKTDLKI